MAPKDQKGAKKVPENDRMLRNTVYVSNMQDEFAQVRRYAHHVECLQKARSRVEMKPRPILVSTFLKIHDIKQDHYSMKRIIRSNIDLIKKMSCLQLNKGFIDTYNHTEPIPCSRNRPNVKRLIQIQRSNLQLACKLLTIKSSMNTRELLSRSHNSHYSAQSFIPENILEKYENIFTNDHRLLRKLLRPKVYFDLEVQNIRPLGRIEVQLFTEACPELVLQFVRHCTLNRSSVFHLIRIFPLLWIEGELQVNNEILSRPDFEHKMHVLDHGTGPGIFSFAKCYLNGFPSGLLNFTISFKSLPVLAGERVPFGLVTRGLKDIDCLQDYGTKNGKTTKNIVIVKCGLTV